MAGVIHIHRNGLDFGPYEVEEAKRLLKAGNLEPDDLAWEEGTEGWMPLAELPCLTPPPEAEPEPLMEPEPIPEPEPVTTIGGVIPAMTFAKSTAPVAAATPETAGEETETPERTGWVMIFTQVVGVLTLVIAAMLVFHLASRVPTILEHFSTMAKEKLLGDAVQLALLGFLAYQGVVGWNFIVNPETAQLPRVVFLTRLVAAILVLQLFTFLGPAFAVPGYLGFVGILRFSGPLIEAWLAPHFSSDALVDE